MEIRENNPSHAESNGVFRLDVTIWDRQESLEKGRLTQINCHHQPG